VRNTVKDHSPDSNKSSVPTNNRRFEKPFMGRIHCINAGVGYKEQRDEYDLSAVTNR